MASLLLPIIYLAFISLGLPDALLGAAALIALMLALAGGWRVIKQRYQQANQGLLAAALVGGTLVFLAG